MDDDSVFWTGTKRKTAYFLLGTALLSLGQPLVVALTDSGARFYLLQPLIFEWQAFPNLLAAGLWLPWRSAWASKVALQLSTLLFIASALFYIPTMIGLVPIGGDMVALGYILFALVTAASIVVATVIGFGVAWYVHRRREKGREATTIASGQSNIR
jgi:hypothetical protein